MGRIADMCRELYAQMRPGLGFCITRKCIEDDGLSVDLIRAIPVPPFRHVALMCLETDNVMIIRLRDDQNPYELFTNTEDAGEEPSVISAMRKL